MLGWNTCLRLKFAALCKSNSGFVLQLATRGRVIRYAGSHPRGNHQEAQLQLWEDLFSNPSEWWDNRLDKKSPQHPDFRHKKTREPLWLNNQYKPLWVCPRLAILNARPHDEQGAVQMASLVGSSRPNDELHSLCEQGLLDKAIDLLSCMDQKGTVPSVHVYASLLRVCAKRRALDKAKQVHSHLAKHGLESTQFLGESVVRTLVKCGGLEDALQVFQKLSNRTAFSWTALISGFTTAGNCNRALRMYDCMLEEGLEPNKYTFVSLLKACSAIFDLKKGKRIHGEALKYGYHDDLYVGTCLIDMYAKCGSVVDAQNVFDALPQRDVVAWTAIISAYIQQGEASKALQLYGQMKKENVSPDAWIFVSALQACGMLAEKAGIDGVDRIGTKTRSLQTGRAIHAEACSRGFKSNLLVANTLMSMYGKCGSVVDASNVFHGLLQRDVASWNVMILAYAQEGQPDKAFQLYEKMLQEGNSPDARTFVGALQACCKLNEDLISRGRPNKVTPLEWGHIIHSEAWERGYNSDVFVGSSLVLMYSTCGSIVDARSVFDSWSRKDVVLWNAMLGAYAQKGQARKAFDLYDHMQEEGLSPDVRTLVSILQACGMLTENEEDTVVLDGRAAKAEALARGKEIHAAVFRKGYESDVFVGNTLISMYGKCGSIVDARRAFVGVPKRDVLSWNAILLANVEQGQAEDALVLYDEMVIEGMIPDARTFVCAIQACGMLAGQEEEDDVGERLIKAEFLERGKVIHAHAWSNFREPDLFVSNALINMYGKCRSIVDAEKVFHDSPQQDAMSWNSMLAAYVHQSKAEKALRLYEQMLEEGPTPNDRTIVSVVQACGMLAEEAIHINGQLVKTKCLVSVKALQSAAWSFGYSHDLFVRNSVLSMYAKCGSILDAEIIFYGLHKECVKSWNAMISVHVIQGQAEKVLQLHDQMLEDGVRPDDQTLVSMLHACAMLAEHEEETLVDGQRIRVKALQRVKIAHADAWIRGFTLYPHTCKSLVSTYGKCGSIMDAQSILDGLSETDVLSWNALLTCYAHSGQAKKTLEMYKQMIDELVSPNAGTFMSMMQAFSSLGEKEDDVTLDGAPTRILWLKEAKTIQAEMWRMGYGQNQFIGNTLISMYGRLGSIADALAVFERLPESTIVSWNVLLVAYALQHQVEKVFELYEQMLHEGVSPDDRTYVSLLQACGMLAEKEDIVTGDEQSIKVKALDKGKAIHAAAWASGYKSDVFIGNTLVSMYGKCGSLLDAQTVFNGLPQRTVVSWNSILTAYTQKGQEQRSLDLYREMLEEGVSPDVITLMSLLQACSKTGCLDSCRQLHHSLVSTRKYLSPILASTLIHAYGRCASMVEAQNAFNLLPQPDVVSWNALCAGYARQGDWEAVLRCYTEMQLADVRPNGVTFLSLLSACSHAGLVDQGVTYFNAMTRDHSISPETEHYASMIDLLGRAGYFTLVEDVLSAMPMQPNLSTWLCLLGACRKHGKVSLGQHAFDSAIRVDPNHCAPYVLMSNIYAQAGMWDRANEVNEFRLKASAWNNPGQSWIKFEEEIHTFVVGDFQHRQDMQLHNLIGYLRLAIEATEHSRHGI